MKYFLLTLAGVLALSGSAWAGQCAPAKVTTLAIEAVGYSSYTISWTATGDDCATGNPTSYEVRRSTSNITDTNWQSAELYDSGSSVTNGNEQCVGVQLMSSTTHYYAVFLFDDAGNRSPISNVISANARWSTPFTEVECP